MKPSIPSLTIAFILCDVLVGLLFIFWPGAWHELSYPHATRTTFYLLQQVGFIVLARGLIALVVLRRRWDAGRQAIGLMWLIEVPAHLFGIAALHDWSLFGTEIALVRVLMCAWAARVFLRMGRRRSLLV
ncbi:MAG: hypothetical protein VX589_06275 [Myxococcota bacterium]|nr:hypothetical protein [Myxococcota bacterium]